MRTVHLVVPDGIDDPARPSGGNSYDRHIGHGLQRGGWDVREHPVAESWPEPGPGAQPALAAVLAGLPDDAVVLIDGLIASALPSVLVPASQRLALVVLVHMPFDTEQEAAVLAAATAVITTSPWARNTLLRHHRLGPDAVHVAEPGVDPAELASGSPDGGELLCVAAVAPHKGHDVLLEALAAVAHLPWRCACIGPLDRDRDFVGQLRRQAAAAGINDRVQFGGPRTGADLDAAYRTADLLVLPSRGETYGMVVTEALAHGLPVVATAVGGVPDALGRAAGGRRPGLLVPVDDPAALATALSSWLGRPELRASLGQAARERRAVLADWSATTDRIARVLTEAAGRAVNAHPGRRV